jgi:hypothetical protein
LWRSSQAKSQLDQRYQSRAVPAPDHGGGEAVEDLFLRDRLKNALIVVAVTGIVVLDVLALTIIVVLLVGLL